MITLCVGSCQWQHLLTRICHQSAAGTTEMAATTLSPRASMKKLARYCCQECGAKELFLYCWKGCRHIQNLKAFYSETKSICQEVDTLKTTIYEQELLIRDMEARLSEKQQSLELLIQQIDQMSKSTPIKSRKEPNLPLWANQAVRIMVQKYDVDKDGELNSDELAALSCALKRTNPSFDPDVLIISKNERRANELAILKYYERSGLSQLQTDLHVLGINFGLTPDIAEIVAGAMEQLGSYHRHKQDLESVVMKLHNEVNEKSRATTRLREGFAEVKMALDGKDQEIQCAERRRTVVDQELEATKDKLTTQTAELKRVASDLAMRNAALQDMRLLVEDQVYEKEKWQRYCWGLEERLYDAVHANHVKERDLWAVRDAKKEEARKNRILYMDRGMGKKHFGMDKDGHESHTEVDKPDLTSDPPTWDCDSASHTSAS